MVFKSELIPTLVETAPADEVEDHAARRSFPIRPTTIHLHALSFSLIKEFCMESADGNQGLLLRLEPLSKDPSLS